MTSQQDTELPLDEILFEVYRSINSDGKEGMQHQQAIQALTSWKDKEVKKAQLGMIEYYDQVPNNKDMDWKGLFADNRKQIQYELESLQSQNGGSGE